MKRELALAIKAVGYYSKKNGLFGQTESFETVVKTSSQFYSTHEIVRARKYFDKLVQARKEALTAVKKRSNIAALI
jgi:hypothetical protein